MMIIGCDLHTRYQQIAMLDTETGELVERRLEHESGEAQGGWPTFDFRRHHHNRGCPTLRDFRSVGTTDDGIGALPKDREVRCARGTDECVRRHVSNLCRKLKYSPSRRARVWHPAFMRTPGGGGEE